MAQRQSRLGRVGRSAAGVVVTLRWFVVLGWVAVAVAATVALPDIRNSQGGLAGLLPENSAAVAAEARSYRLFDLPVLSRIAVVQHDPGGLTPQVQARSVATAVKLDARLIKQGVGNVPPDEPLAALPILNTGRVFPSASEDGTTAITYLFASPYASFLQQTDMARAYGEQLGGEAAGMVGPAGLIPAQNEQARLILTRLPAVEVATIGLVLLIVGLALRSIVAPLVPVVTTVLAYLVTVRALGALGQVADIVLPQELEPLIIALLLGIVTDYALFYLYGLARHVEAGETRLTAAHGAARDYSRIVMAAGLTVAAVTASLLAARLGIYRSFGPGLAVTVLVGLVVSVTLIPALLGIFGRFLLWPSALGRGKHPRRGRPSRLKVHAALHRAMQQRLGLRPHWLIRALARRGVAAVVALACLIGLLLAAAPVRNLRLDLSFTAGLPSSNPVQQAAEAAGRGFAPGILSPTVLLVEGKDITDRRGELARLQNALAAQPGVAGVLGPAQQPLPEAHGVVLSRTGDAARYLLVLDSDPLSAAAVHTVEDLRGRVPGLLGDAGLPTASASFVGNTAVAVELVEATATDLRRVALVAAGISLLLLVLFLRSLVAPLYLLAGNVLSVASALGLTTWMFQDQLGRAGVTFYVPFATAVLLIALGSDYNVFTVGEVWAEARTRPLREALVDVIPRSARIITTAGIALAGSVGLVALIPLWPFQEIAFTMTVGLLLDVFVVRLLLVPSFITLVGPVSRWPAGAPRPAVS